jgi:hypothetical protein
MSKIFKLILTAFAAWLFGLATIALRLYLSNGGADFTLTDVMGFGILFVIASGLLMLLIYWPALLWFRRKTDRGRLWYPLLPGVLLNLPIFIVLSLLIGRKMAASEAVSFMAIFFVAGSVFGMGFLWAYSTGEISKPPHVTERPS